MELQESAEQALKNIEGIIKHFQGKPLANQPNVLGAIPIEITVAGVNPLAKCDAVKAIMENQSISLMI